MTAKAHAALGAGAIVVALVLVPFIWSCGKGVAGWNVLVFVLIAFGGSQFGAAVGRWTHQRVVGILATVAAVLLALVVIGAITARTC